MISITYPKKWIHTTKRNCVQQFNNEASRLEYSKRIAPSPKPEISNCIQPRNGELGKKN